MALRIATTRLFRQATRFTSGRRNMSEMSFTFAAPNAVHYDSASVKQVRTFLQHISHWPKLEVLPAQLGAINRQIFSWYLIYLSNRWMYQAFAVTSVYYRIMYPPLLYYHRVLLPSMKTMVEPRNFSYHQGQSQWMKMPQFKFSQRKLMHLILLVSR